MKLLVNAPSGLQQIIQIGEGGGYFDAVMVIWDERTDGLLPLITLGGMKREGNKLVFDEQLLTAHNAVKDAGQAKSVRALRDIKLSETDWRVLPDVSNSDVWKTYRQALRDIPAQSGFPWTITWPDAP